MNRRLAMIWVVLALCLDGCAPDGEGAGKSDATPAEGGESDAEATPGDAATPGDDAEAARDDAGVTCPDGGEMCEGTCQPPSFFDSNPAHCGDCGVVCPADATCDAGACVCPAGRTRCGDECTDLETTWAHCGECGANCEGPERCRSGECVGGEMVRVEAGTFTLGSPDGEPGRRGSEGLREVTLTRAFLLKATEVTEAEWFDVMASRPAQGDCGEDCPVDRVSWHDAVDYANALSAREGLPPCYGEDHEFVGLDCGGYRLPTEAEWEAAARAGTQTALHSGDLTYSQCDDPVDPNLDRVGWYCTNAGGARHPVAQKEPNAWGLYDMHGNVFEWVTDRYAIPMRASVDPVGPSAADAVSEARVYRGGSYDATPTRARSAHRASLDPDFRWAEFGFRVARTAPD